MMALPTSTTSAAVRKVYRQLYHILKQQPNPKAEAASSLLNELRTSFRRPLQAGETIQDRLHAAESRLSFLRITTVKTKPRGEAGTWVYKDGERLTNVSGTVRDSNGRVVSGYDGKNLDPEAVKRHKQTLKRAGFINNAHAKGIF